MGEVWEPTINIRYHDKWRLPNKRDGSFAVSFSTCHSHRTRSSQKATALAAATFRESTPWAMGMRTV